MVNILPGSKTDRRLETYLEPQTSESVYKAKEIQNGDSANCDEFAYKRQMGYINRSERRLSACTHSSHRSEMAPFSHSGQGLRIPMPSLWPFYEPTSLHPHCKGRGGFSASAEYPDPHVLRRLDHYQLFKGGSFRPPSDSSGYSKESGFSSESQEIQPDSVSVSSFSGSTVGSQVRSCYSLHGQGVQHGSVCRNSKSVCLSSGCSLAQSSGSNGQFSGSSPMVSLPHAAYSTSPSVLLHSVPASHSCFSSNVGRGAQGAGVVGRSSKFTGRRGLPHSFYTGDINDRCLLPGLGRSLRVPEIQRGVVSGRIQGSHKSTGAMGSLQCAQSFRGEGSGQACSSEDRQFDGCSLHQSSRGDEISLSLSSYEGPAEVVYSAGNISLCSSHSRETEYSGGQSLQGSFPQSNRVVTISSGSSNSVCGDFSALDRPVCVDQESQTSSVLLKESGRESIGHGRSIDLVEGDDGLCLPSNLTDCKSPSENREGGLSDSSDSSILASTALVSQRHEADSWAALSSSSDSGSPQDAGIEGSVSRSRSSAPNCMAIVTKRLQEKGLSRESAQLAAAGRRESTYRVYSARLRPYYRWCKRRKVAADRASIGVVADFLRSLFKKGLQVSTIKGYRSAIQAIHNGFEDGSTVGSNESLHLLIEGMFIQRPPNRKILPAWDLPTVLRFLKDPPFEPAQAASLRSLTLKSVFLIALASGRRCSEIHALCIGRNIVFSERGATLYFCPGFLAKNERSNFTAKPIFLPSLNPGCDRKDRLNCPVRILRWYLDRTSLVRVIKGNPIQQLFITTQKNAKPAAKATISGWLVEVIRQAKAFAGPLPSAHSSRSVSSSWAFYHGVSVSEILNAVSWKSDSAFINCYLKDAGPCSDSFATTVLNADAHKH